MTFTQQLHRLRTKTQNQQELSTLLGVSFVTLNSWINERSKPRTKHQASVQKLYEKYFGRQSIDHSLLAEKKTHFHSLHGKFLIDNFLHSQSVLNDFLITLTYHTNSIEGSTVTFADTQAMLIEKKTFSNYSLREQIEVANHKKAFFEMLSLCKQKGISVKQIEKLHKILMAGLLDNAGIFRYHSVRILGSQTATANYLKIPILVENFVEDFNIHKPDTLQHFAQSHATFEKIHPFSDGNGRIGRLLLILHAFQNGYPPILLPKERKYAYYQALQSAQLREDYSFLEMMISEEVWGEQFWK